MQDKVTIIMPVSRADYLSPVFSALEVLECDRRYTNLVVIVDGDDKLFINVRNLTAMSKFNETLCVPYSKRDEPKVIETDLIGRRQRIADIHNELKTLIGECKYVLGIEDDTVIPPKTLAHLLEDLSEVPHAGFIQGVELGRWHKPYIGAWLADDIYEPHLMSSIMPRSEFDSTRGNKAYEPIDAGGLFCFISKKEIYTSHDFKTFENNGMGPDADYGMTLRQLGYSNFIDWRIKCIHLFGDEKISLATHKPVHVYFTKHPNRKTWQFHSK